MGRPDSNSADDSVVMLAIETSQRTGGVALSVGGTIYSEALVTKTRHDDDLLPAIDRLLRRCDIKPNQLTHVAVSIGPGGFTGLRIAVATAKMLAETLGVKIVSVPSALSAAYNYSGEGSIVVALASKNEQFWCTHLTRDNNDWVIEGEASLADAQSAELDGVKALLSDQYLPASMREFCQTKAIPIAEIFLSAEGCLRAADHLRRTQKPANPLILTPIYARVPEAVSIWEKRRKSGIS